MKAAAAMVGILGALLGLGAFAHPALDNPRAEAGSSYRAAIRITHGCSGSPVREVIVQIPEGVHGAKPMPKPGWQIAIEPRAIRWSGGRIDNGYFDEFVLLVQLPEAPGTLYWKVSQVCEQGRIDWFDTSGDGKTPAASLEVLPSTGHSGHKH